MVEHLAIVQSSLGMELHSPGKVCILLYIQAELKASENSEAKQEISQVGQISSGRINSRLEASWTTILNFLSLTVCWMMVLFTC